MYSAKPGVRELVALLVAHGVRSAVVCAGSRSVPIAHSLAACPAMTCYPAVDERSACFTAIGLAEALKKPVCVCCTSGSALLDMAPAVAEAYYRHVPLVLVSADRPQAWIGQLDGQTLVQPGAFKNFIRFEANLPEPKDSEDLWHLNRLINEALCAMKSGDGGPVHINVPLSEPLFAMDADNLPYPRIIVRDDRPRTQPSADMLREWRGARRPLVVAGQMAPGNGLEAPLRALARSGCVVIAEHLANLPELQDEPNVIGRAEQLLAAPELGPEADGPGGAGSALEPDLVISIGGHAVSKRLKKFLRRRQPAFHWHISLDGDAPDTFQSLTRAVRGQALGILTSLSREKREWPDAAFAKAWDAREKAARRAIALQTDEPFADIPVMRRFLAACPEQSALILANSSPVRSAQFFDVPKDCEILCNRGVNGIDGSLSEAVGYALATRRTVFALIGDLSFFYDQNALWRESLPANLRILLFANGGGGIFSQLPGLTSEHLDRFLAGATRANPAGTALAFGLEHKIAASFAELEQELAVFCAPNRRQAPILLEVKTDIPGSAAYAKDLIRQAGRGKASGSD